MAQYYNLAVIKDAKERAHVFPVTTAKPVNSPPLLRRDIDNCINQRPFLSQSKVPRGVNYSEKKLTLRLISGPNRIVSSTCPSTPPPPQSLTNSIIITDDPGGTTDTGGGNNVISFDHTLNGYSSRGDASSVESFQCILNRRQRGEKRPIPDEQKDDKYFERRKRNNEAAKKSRDARKMREDRVKVQKVVDTMKLLTIRPI